MENYIQELNADLAETERLMRSFLPTPSGFEELLSLYLLYRKHNHTDAIIEYAESVIKSGEGMDRLLADAKELERRVTGCQRLYVENREAFDSIDNDTLFKAHIRPYREAEQAEIEIATRSGGNTVILATGLTILPLTATSTKTWMKNAMPSRRNTTSTMPRSTDCMKLSTARQGVAVPP